MQAEVKRLEEKLRRESRGLDTPEKRSKISRLNLNLCVTKLKLEKLDNLIQQLLCHQSSHLSSKALSNKRFPPKATASGRSTR